MIYSDSLGHPSGTIVVAAGTQPRFYEFQISMERLIVPTGTRFFIERGCDITHNFNDGVERAIGDWIWFMGDDHSFPNDMLIRLLDREVDVVIPPTPCKTNPFLPCIMHGSGSLDEWKPSMSLYTWAEISNRGLLALPIGDFIGQAGMLVKRSVFADWPSPWFQAGQQDPGRLQEDMTFCRELQKRGHTIWLDTDQVIEHWFIVGITAKHHNAEWVPGLINGHDILLLPDALADRQPDGSTRLRRVYPMDGGSKTAAPLSRVAWLSNGSEMTAINDNAS